MLKRERLPDFQSSRARTPTRVSQWDSNMVNLSRMTPEMMSALRMSRRLSAHKSRSLRDSMDITSIRKLTQIKTLSLLSDQVGQNSAAERERQSFEGNPQIVVKCYKKACI